MVRFAVSLGKTTTAEGVETKEQLEILRAEGCTEMQGYYFSRPKRGSQFTPTARAQIEQAKVEQAKVVHAQVKPAPVKVAATAA